MMQAARSDGPRPLVRRLAFVPAVLWAVFIFVLSAQSATISDGTSRGLVREVAGFVASVTHWTALSPADPGFEERIDLVDSVFREAMHAVEYLVLGLLVGLGVRLRAGRGWRKRTDRRQVLRIALFCWLACVAYSLTDEFHQLFVPGRAFQLLDLTLDAIGSAIGVISSLRVFRS